MALNDVFRVTMKVNVVGEDCFNVFHYQQISSQASAAPALSAGFYTDVFPTLKALAPVGVTFDTLECSNIRVGADYSMSAFGVGDVGIRAVGTSELAPSWLAVSFNTNRPFPGTRSGRKRFPFLIESDFSGNYLTTVFEALAVVVNTQAILGVDVTDTNGTFRPVIVKSGYAIGDPTRPAVVSYPATVWVVQDKLASQDSRKPT